MHGFVVEQVVAAVVRHSVHITDHCLVRLVKSVIVRGKRTETQIFLESVFFVLVLFALHVEHHQEDVG